MGVVYLARDPRLHRPVAIKVLPDLFAKDAGHLARFEREATLLASLSHPNIAGIYGFETSGTGERLLVLELVDGDTLATRIARGPLPIDEALGIAGQIAGALAAAHDAGIIHRDLKPANVKVREDGTVKVLDFGLAKAFDPAGHDPGLHPSDSPTNIPTMTSPALTGMGVILGTAAYMSPEQARGRAVDRRADIWALGAVLFEMLTGHRPFGGETVTDTLASVVMREPDWKHLPAATPPSVVRLLRRCLIKDPKRRLRDAADLRVEIEDALAAPLESTGNIASSSRVTPRRPMWMAIAAVVLLAIVGTAAFVVGQSSAAPTNRALRVLSLAAPGLNAPVAISPNGEWLAAASQGQLHMRRLDEATWHEIPNVSGIQAGSGSLFWSPDSKFLGFATDTAIKRVDLVGSRPETICEGCVVPEGLRGASWGRDNKILLGGNGSGEAGGLQAISVHGGERSRVTKLDPSRGENSHRLPFFLPDGRRFLFAVRRVNGEHEIRLASLDGTAARTVVSGFSQVAYAAGHILFVRNAALFAQPFDLAKGVVAGDPFKVLDRISHSATIGWARFSVADDGTLVAGSAPDAVGFKWFDRRGTALANLTDMTSSSSARISPNGRRAAISYLDPDKASSDLHVIDVGTRVSTRLTSNPNWEEAPVWSPDNLRIAYRANYAEHPGVYVQDANGGNERMLLEQSPPPYPLDWSPDGKHVLAGTSGDLILISASGPIHAEPWLATKASEESARFSLDGKFVAYKSTESGSGEIHVRSFSNPAITRRVTTAGGTSPVWSRDGHELFYMDLNLWITAVSITTGSTIEIGPPQRLFRIAQREFIDNTFDVDKQGRFLVYDIVNNSVTPTQTILQVLLNWQSANGPGR